MELLQHGISGKDDDDSESLYPPIRTYGRRIIDSLSAQISILDKEVLSSRPTDPSGNYAWKMIVDRLQIFNLAIIHLGSCKSLIGLRLVPQVAFHESR